MGALNARDWRAAGACLTADAVIVNNVALSPTAGERDCETWLAQFESLVGSAGDVRGGFDVVADVDELMSSRFYWRGHLNEGGGEFEMELAWVARRRGDRFDRLEGFEPDDDAAGVRFAELLGERGAALAVGVRWWGHQRSRDWNALLALCSTDATFLDRRQVGAGEIGGPARLVEFARGLVELVPDVGVHVVQVLDITSELCLSQFEMRGTATDGGEIEVPYLTLVRVRTGLIDLGEMFDPGDEDLARQRFEELARVDMSAGNGEFDDRFATAYNGRDWDGLRDLYVPDVRVIDRRHVGLGEFQGPDQIVEHLRGGPDLSPDMRVEVERLAVGRSAWLVRTPFRGHIKGESLFGSHPAAGGGEVEIDLVSLNLAAEDTRVKYIELFDGADVATALARFEEIGAQTEPERLYARVCRLVNARDWDGLAACYAEDSVSIDRRPLGWEDTGGREEIVEVYRSWIEVAPDAELRFEALDGDDEHIALRLGGDGHAADGGGRLEYEVIVVATVRDGRIVRAERFDAGEEAAALARLAELVES